jgi:hypothetical protein
MNGSSVEGILMSCLDRCNICTDIHHHNYYVNRTIWEEKANLKCAYHTFPYHQGADWCNNNTLDLCSESTQFESSHDFSQSLQANSICSNRPLLLPSISLPAHHSCWFSYIIWCYITSTVRTVSLNNIIINQSTPLLEMCALHCQCFITFKMMRP